MGFGENCMGIFHKIKTIYFNNVKKILCKKAMNTRNFMIQ